MPQGDQTPMATTPMVTTGLTETGGGVGKERDPGVGGAQIREAAEGTKAENHEGDYHPNSHDRQRTHFPPC